MKRKFLLLVMMCLLGGFSSSLMAQDVTIGDLSSTLPSSANYPFASKYKYALTQQIYTPDVIKSYNEGDSPTGEITKIKYYIAETALKEIKDVRVYMRNSDVNTFNSGKGNSADKLMWDKEFATTDLLFKGDVQIVNNEIELVFNQGRTFTYDPEKNLIIYFDVETKNETQATTKFKYTTKLGDNSSITHKSVLYHRNDTRNGGLTNNGLGDYGWGTASGSPASYLSVVTLTFSSGGSVEKQAPTFTDTYAYPNGQYATNIFNPSLSFYAENKTHYKVLLSTKEDFSANVRYIAGSESSWAEAAPSIKEVSTANISGLTYNPATTYYWKVIASNGGKADDPTAEKVYSFTTKEVTAAPDEIENATPNNEGIADSNPKLEWEFAENTEDYQVVLDGETKVEWTNKGSSTKGSYQTSNLGAGTHTWQVNTRNSAGTKTGTEYSFTVIGAPGKVTPIFPLDGATGIAEATIKFRFAESTTHYKVFFATTDDPNPSHPYTFLQPLTNDWVATNGASEMEVNVPVTLTLSKKYYWTVEVKNGAGETKYFNYVQGKPIKWDLYGDPIEWEQIHTPQVDVYSFTSASTLPVTYAYPENNAVASEVNPALSWNYQGSAAWYQVLFGTSEDNLAVFKDWTARGSNDSFQTTGLNATSQYYWQVNVKETENSEVLYGEIVSFITKLEVPQNVNANPTEVEPSLSEYGATQIMWNKINGANSYNIYLDGEMLANTARNSYNVEDNTLKLKSNIDPGYNFTVTAVYEEYGESQASEAVNVKVANIGTPIVYVKDADNKPIEGVTIELTGINEFGKEKTYTITTDKDGKGSKSVLVADYAMTVSKEPYSTKFYESVKIEKNSEKIVNVMLTSEYYYSVTAKETEANGNIKLTLTGKDAGSYDIYIKTNGVESLLVKDAWFDGFGSAQYEYTSWNTLNNGTYQFGVANSNSNIINWSNEITRNYAIFETEGNWNTASNWRDGLPKENDDVLIYANATIAATDNITVADVNIIEGSLTINGSLTADKVYNETNNAEAVCVNDGGQLFQNNTELSGKFVMNIRNDWSASNKGWQFISSPFIDATTASFESTEGDFDLYKYDGSKENEWVNYKNTGDDSGEEPETPGEEPGEKPELPEVGGKSEFSFNFDDGSLEGWEIIDKDGDGYGWYLTYENGSLVLISESWVNKKLVPDDYIVTTEKYTITESSLLSFSHIQYDTYAYNEHIGVVISEDGENYTTIWDYDYDGENFLTEWKTEVVDLSEYAGKNLYLGIRYYDCNGDEATGILVDNITLTTGSKTRNSNTRSFDEETFAQGVGYLASYEIQATATLVGTFNTKTSFDYKVSYTADKELANFHLLGNPFTFNMDWSKATAKGLVDGYAVVNNEGGYDYLTSGTINVGDGFFVKANAENPSLSYDHSYVAPVLRGSEKANSINVIASGKAGKDNVVVNFAGQAEGFNKLQNFNDAIATVYVSENSKNYGIANVDENTTEVALNFDAKEMGNYTISLDVNGEFETIILVDRFTGVETDMLVENEYSFIASNDDNVNRFVIRLANGQQTTDNSQFVYQSGEELILSIEGSVQIVDMLGRVVYSNEHASDNNRINVGEFNDATYVVRVVNEEGVKVQKVVIY